MAKKKLTEEEKAKLAEKKARMLKAQKEKAQKYWEDRAQARVLATDKSTQETERELLRAYQRAQQEIIQSVNDFYKRFAKDAQISGEQARELLTLKEYSNFKTEFHRKRMELKKLLSKDPRNIALRRYDKDFEKLSKLRKLTREETLLASIKHECIKLAAAQDKAMESGMAKSYGEAKDESRKDFAKAGLKTADKQSPETPVHKAIHEKWLGKDFSSRIWEDKNKLIEELRIILAQAFVIHEGIRNLSFRLATRLNVNINNAKRLIRTEFNHIANQASLDSYKRDGVKKYKFLAAIDSRTSDVCKSVNGQIFEVTKAKVGLNFPPMHPNCRSTTVAVFEDDDGRYDYIDVELNDEELAELGISREEYDAIRANNDEQAKAQASPLAISNKEAKAAEDATHSMEAKRKEEKRIENEAKAIIDAEKQEKERIDDLLFDIDYEAGWLDIWETLSQTPTTVSMQAERLETIQTKLDSCEDIVDKLEKRIEKIDPQTPPAPPKGKSAPEPTQELAKAKEKELAKAEEKTKPKNLPTRLRKIVDKARKTLTKLSGMLGKAKSRLSSLFERFKDKVKTVFGWDDDDHDGGYGVGFMSPAISLPGGYSMPSAFFMAMSSGRWRGGSHGGMPLRDAEVIADRLMKEYAKVLAQDAERAKKHEEALQKLNKANDKDIVAAGKTADRLTKDGNMKEGRYFYLNRSGLIHILHRHGFDFDPKLAVDDPNSRTGMQIVKTIVHALETGRFVGNQKEKKSKKDVDKRGIYVYEDSYSINRQLSISLKTDGEIYGANKP